MVVNHQGEFIPLGGMSEAFPLGVHLILLYFIRISLLTPETFFYLGGGWKSTFGFFKSLYNNMVYTLGIYIHVYI